MNSPLALYVTGYIIYQRRVGNGSSAERDLPPLPGLPPCPTPYRSRRPAAHDSPRGRPIGWCRGSRWSSSLARTRRGCAHGSADEATQPRPTLPTCTGHSPHIGCRSLMLSNARGAEPGSHREMRGPTIVRSGRRGGTPIGRGENMKAIKLAVLAAVAVTVLGGVSAPALAKHHDRWHKNGREVCHWYGHGRHRHRECHFVR